MRSSSFIKLQRKAHLTGFAMTEIIMALFAVGIAAFLIAGLMRQLSLLGNKSNQTGVVFEFRNKVNAISKNPEEWLNRMRATHGEYAACIPDAASVSSTFKCPDIYPNIKDDDSVLEKAAGPSLHVASGPMIDLLGEELAGSVENPLYLDLNGRPCAAESPATNCPLISTGYFLRSNNAANQNPGNVRFIVKLQRNLAALTKNPSLGAMKPEFLSIELGTGWSQSSKKTPAGTIRVGYLADGTPRFLDPTLDPLKSCSSGQIYVGSGADGSVICKSLPTCPSGQNAAIGVNGEVECSSKTNPCTANQVFLGFYSGSGQPMCTGLTSSCSAPAVQMGLTPEGNAICKDVPSTCTPEQKVSYNGLNFSCVDDVLGKSCEDGEIMTGVDSAGQPVCKEDKTILTSAKLDCEPGFYVSGIESDGSVKCAELVANNLPLRSCDDGYYLAGFDSEGTMLCRPLPTTEVIPEKPETAKCSPGSNWVNIKCYALNKEVDGGRGYKSAATNKYLTDMAYCSSRSVLCYQRGGTVSDMDTTEAFGRLEYCASRWGTGSNVTPASKRGTCREWKEVNVRRREHSCTCSG